MFIEKPATTLPVFIFDANSCMPLSDSDRDAIFQTLRTAMLKCCPPMVNVADTPGNFEIIGNVPVPYGATKKIIPGMYFASAVTRKDMVSFYLFPLYTNSEAFSDMAPNAMNCLKGKNCFNFKKPEQAQSKEIDTILKQAMALWKKAGYTK